MKTMKVKENSKGQQLTCTLTMKVEGDVRKLDKECLQRRKEWVKAWWKRAIWRVDSGDSGCRTRLVYWDDYKGLSDLAYENYPGTMLGTYFEARYEEETGNPKKAMRTYQNAYGQEKIAFLNTDFMLAKADAIKKDFGY